MLGNVSTAISSCIFPYDFNQFILLLSVTGRTREIAVKPMMLTAAQIKKENR